MRRRPSRVPRPAAEGAAEGARLEEVLLGERTRIGDRLHDEILSLILTLRQDLLEEAVEPTEAVASADRLIGAVRSLIVTEHPEAVDRRGIADALDDIARPLCARSGVELLVDVAGAATLTTAQRPLVLAAVRELVENATRHARASRVSVVLRSSATGLLVCVRDDGVGLDLEQASAREAAGHLGLRRLRLRAAAAGGQLRISPGRPGTTILLDLPNAT